MRRTERRKHGYGAKRSNAQSPFAKWRKLPATEAQWAVLKKIGAESNVDFAPDITRGEASEAITARFRENPEARAAAKRAETARRREARRKAA